MARLRNAPSTQPPSSPRPQSKRQALRENTNTARAKVPLYEDDGNTEDLVKAGKPKRGRPKKTVQNEDELVMAGGLGQAETEGQNSQAPMTTDELAKSDGPPPPTVKANRRPPRMTRKPIQSQVHNEVLEGLKKRMEETARKEAGKGGTLANVSSSRAAVVTRNMGPTEKAAARKSSSSRAERSEFSISPSPPPPVKLSSMKKQRSSLAQRDSAVPTQSTPAVESSVLALKNFKRRPRQPSMLQMVQQRTASARPSAVRDADTEDPSIFDMEMDDDIEDDFEPDAEGTPVDANKKKRRASVPAEKKRASHISDSSNSRRASRKRKSDAIERSDGAVQALSAKRRKATVLDAAHDQHQFEQPTSMQMVHNSPMRSPSSERRATPRPQLTSDVLVNNSQPSSTPPTEPSSDRDHDFTRGDYAVPSTEQERDEAQPAPLDDFDEDDAYNAPIGTMAEPASSSPLAANPLENAQLEDDNLADPVTQISPLPKRPNPMASRIKPMTTANLQALLPKRRQPIAPRHRKSAYDFTSEGEEEDAALGDTGLDREDDSIESADRGRRKTKTAPVKTRKAPTAKTKAKGRQTKAPASTRKSKGHAPTAKKPTKTYGRAITSDKENEEFEDLDGEEDTELPEVSMPDVVASRELEEAKRKFAEVDEWDMEFESMSVEEHRSSSQQWR